nr:MAG TPA: hypothetical protein [Bacteriophage sp.]
MLNFLMLLKSTDGIILLTKSYMIILKGDC